MTNEWRDTHLVSESGNEGSTGNIPAFWRSRLSGKRVCIVGNARSIAPPQLPIDEHDIVIRFNDGVRGGLWGSRTSFYCITLRKEVRTDPDGFRAEGIPLVFTGREPSGNCELTWEFAGRDLARSLGCWPSSGLMAVHIACACKAAHVTLAAMTLAYPLAREPWWAPRYAPPWAYHNFLGERRRLAGLLRPFEGSIDLPQALSALRHGAFNRPTPCWGTLASALVSVSQMTQNRFGQVDISQGEVAPDVQDVFRDVAGELSVLEPSMDGVRQLEPFFHLSTDKHLHPERWLLFHPAGARLMDDLLVRLRILQTRSLSV